MDALETGQNTFKVAAQALLNACAELRYDCTFIGQVACFAYRGSRPPAKIEAVATSTVAREHYPSTGSLKRLIASIPTGVDGTFVISPLDVFPTVLSFRHNKSSGRWQRTLIVDIIFASDVHYADMQPLQTINGMQYASPEYILAHRLKLWFDTYSLPTQTNETREISNTHQIREIDPLLRHLVKTGTKVDKWDRFDGGHVFKYCWAYPNSAGLWIEVGFEPKMADTSNLKSEPPLRNPPPIPPPPSVSAPLTVPPPYERQPPVSSSPTSSSAGARAHITSPPIVRHTQRPPIPLTDPHVDPELAQIQLVLLAAQRTINFLQSMHLSSAICGSLACFLYGTSGVPTDIDILVFPSSDCTRSIIDIKTSLVTQDSDYFYLVHPPHPKRPNPNLFYRLHNHIGTYVHKAPGAACKVNLTFPSTLPHINETVINWDEGLPLIPFPLLLLLKLWSWTSQHNDLQRCQREKGQKAQKKAEVKELAEIEDIRGLFELDLMEELRNEPLWMDRTMFSWEFLTETSSVARRFCERCPEMEEDWRGIKFIF